MPTVLPPPALLVSRSPQIDSGSSRALGQSAKQINGGPPSSPKAKFADALRTAESTRGRSSAPAPDAAEQEPPRATGEPRDEQATAQSQPTDEPSVLTESEVKPDANQAQSEERSAGEHTSSANGSVSESRDSLPRPSAPASPPASETLVTRAQVFQPLSTVSTATVDHDQVPIQNQIQNQQQGSQPSPDRGKPGQTVDNHLQQSVSAVAELPGQTGVVESQRVAPSGDEQSAIQQQNRPRQPQPHSSDPQAQSVNSDPAITEVAAGPQTARQSAVAHANNSSQPNPAIDRPSQRVPSGDSPMPTAARSAAQPTVQVEAQPPQQTPAVARAVQIDAAVRGEHAMPQATASDHAAISNAPQAHTTHRPTLAPALQFKSDNLAQQLPTLGAPIDDSPMTGQVVRGLSAMVNQRGGTMNLRLDPPDLGQLRIQMTVARGVVTAEFHPTTPQAHDLLERNLAALRSTLEGQGLTVERLNVHMAAPSGQHQMMRDDSNTNTPNQQRHQHDAAGGESRGRRDGQQQQEFHREYAFADFQNLLNDLDQFALR